MKNNNAIKYGIISGVVIICYHLGVYFWSKEFLISSPFFFSIYLVHVPFMLATGIKERILHDGLIDFKVALKHIFLTFILGMLFYYLIYYSLFNYDAELIDLMKQATHDGLDWQKEKGFIDEDKYEKFIESMKDADFTVGIWQVITGIPFRIIGGFLLSLVVAAFVKR